MKIDVASVSPTSLDGFVDCLGDVNVAVKFIPTEFGQGDPKISTKMHSRNLSHNCIFRCMMYFYVFMRKYNMFMYDFIHT